MGGETDRGIVANGAAAFGEQAAALGPIVRATIACVLGQHRNHPDVEDCTSETLQRALESHERLREGEPVRPWLLGIARHVAIDHLRRRNRMAKRQVPSSFRSDEDAGPDILETVADAGPSPDDQVGTRQLRMRIDEALHSLTDGQRQALLLFHVEGRGYQEIAEQMQVPMGTVATWIARGRRNISAALSQTREPS